MLKYSASALIFGLLFIGTAAAQVTVPNVVGQPQSAAATAVQSAGLTVGTISTGSSSTIPVGSIISETPLAGSSVAAGSAVNLLVSNGLASTRVPVPTLVGATQSTAIAKILASGLVVGTVTGVPSSATTGTVVTETPSGGTPVNTGSAINLTIANGAAATPATVPDVNGQTQGTAVAALQAASLVTGNVTFTSSVSAPSGTVLIETPAAGTAVNAGSGVNLVISSGPNPIVSVVSVSPASGGGTTQTFTAVYSDINGAGALNRRLFLVSPGLNGSANECYVQVDSSGVHLGSDDGLTLLGPVNSSHSVSNSQCTINGAGTSVVNSGNNSILTVSLTFSASYAGAMNVSMLASDNSNNATGWQTLGSFFTGTVSTAQATPIAATGGGSGTSGVFTFTFSNPNGFAAIQHINVLINDFLDGRHGCYLALVPSSASGGSLYLVDDAGDAGGPYSGMVLPGSSTVQNSQCTISGTGASINGTGTTLTVTLPITFTTTFAGNKIFYLSEQDTGGNSSAWNALATWNIPGPAVTGASVTGMSPAQTSSASNMYTFTFTDTRGWQDIQVADILLNSFLDGRAGCYVAIVPSSATTASVFLVDDAGDAGGPYSGTVIPGSGSVQNSQCDISAATGSINASGNNLTVTLTPTFNHSFTGNRIFYLSVGSKTANQNSGWQAVGNISVP